MSGIPSPPSSPRGSLQGSILFSSNNNNNNNNNNCNCNSNSNSNRSNCDVLKNAFIEEELNDALRQNSSEVTSLPNDTLVLNSDNSSDNSSDNRSDISSVSSLSTGETSDENSIQPIEKPPTQTNGFFQKVFSSVFGKGSKTTTQVQKSAPKDAKWKCLCCTSLNNFVLEFCDTCNAPKGFIATRYVKTSNNIVSECYSDGELFVDKSQTAINGTKVTISGYHRDGIVCTYKGSTLISKNFLPEAFRKFSLIHDDAADKSQIENNVKTLCMDEFGSYPTVITCTGKPWSSNKNKKYIFEFNAQNLLYVLENMGKYVNYIIVGESTTTDNALSTSEMLFDVHEENSLIKYNKYMNELAQKARMMRILKAIAFFVFVISPLFRLLKFIFFRNK